MEVISSNIIIQEITQSQFPVIVNFYDSQCRARRRRIRMIHELAGKYTENLKTVQMYAEEESDLASFFGMSRLPDFLLFQSGRVSGIYKGIVSNEEMALRLNVFKKLNERFLFLVVNILPRALHTIAFKD